MKLALSTLLLILSTFAASAEKARYDNYRVYNVPIENQLQLRALKELSVVSDSYSFNDAPSRVGSDVDLIVPPHQFAHFAELVEKFKLRPTLMNNNLQELIDNESKQKIQLAAGDMDWVSYHNLTEIYDWIEALQEEFPAIITIEDLGTTYEGRPFKLVKLSKQQGNRAVVIEANIHAREWIASATATYVLNELLYSMDPVIQEMAQNIDWYILPVMNPDGFEYTKTDNRNWRKSRKPTSLICFGVDPNRNWEYSWLMADESGNLGASQSACSDTYAGDSPFSEVETSLMNQFLSRTYQQIDVYISMHSYGPMVLHPFGHRQAPVGNAEMLQAIGDATAEKIFAVDGIRYAVGVWNYVLYPSSGVSVDHAYGHYGIPIGYTIEMRGNGPYGNFGFFLPPEFIIPNGLEIIAGLKGLVEKTRQYGYLGAPLVSN